MSKNGIDWTSEKTDLKNKTQTITLIADLDNKIAMQFLVSIVRLCNNFAGVNLLSCKDCGKEFEDDNYNKTCSDCDGKEE